MQKVSIIIPIYKVEKYLNRCVESIVNQTYKNLEIILVDDGSPDTCPQMCDEWAKKDNRIKVIHKVNGGVSSARNAGLNVATGEYVQFVDSDDFLEANACEVLQNNLVCNNADLSIALFKYIGFPLKQPKFKDFVTSDQAYVLKELYKQNIFSVIWNKLYKKKLLKNLTFKDKQKYSEDFLFNCEYLKNCKKISFTNRIIYNYIAVEGSSVHSFSPLCFSNQCYIIDYIETELKLRYNHLHAFLNYLKAEFLLSCFKGIILDSAISKKEKLFIIKEYMESKYYKENVKYAKGLKRKFQIICLNFKLINVLKCIYKIKH